MVFGCCGGSRGNHTTIEDDLITRPPTTSSASARQQQQQEAPPPNNISIRNNSNTPPLVLAAAPPLETPISAATSPDTTSAAAALEPPLKPSPATTATPRSAISTNHPRHNSSNSNHHDTDKDIAGAQQPKSKNKKKIKKMSHHRRDAPEQIGSSLHNSWIALCKDNPDAAEAHQIRRAMELSLLDCALVVRGDAGASQAATEVSPHEILGLGPNATRDEIKAAFRALALQTHPDKGGKMGEFERITVAYRTLMTQTASVAAKQQQQQHQSHKSSSDATAAAALKTSAHWDKELKEHKDLVAELFASHATNVNENVAKQAHVREILGLRHKEAGSSNVNENQERIRNSCFYLSLAVSYLQGIGALEDNFHSNIAGETSPTDLALISQTALQLKRTIEGAVLQAHPEWARAGLVGEEVQAFSDFLVYCLEDTRTILPDWAVAIFDETSGFVDVYKGCQYDKNNNGTSADEDWVQRAHTLTLRFVPGHYQPLLPLRARPNLQEILTTLDHEGVFYVVTDGAL